MVHHRNKCLPLLTLLCACALSACSDEGDDSVTAYNGLGDPAPDAAHVLTCPAVDPERNDSLTIAVELPPLASCSDTTTGVIAGGNDVDYFRFTGNPDAACTSVPSAQVTGDGVRVCIFPVCADGATELGGCGTGKPVYLASGPVGCCSDDTGIAGSVTFACTDPVATRTSSVYLRVDLTTDDAKCHQYTLSYTN